MRRAVVLALLTAAPSTAHAYGESVDGFPKWAERVLHEWMNRARCDPQVEMQACGASCPEGACYTPIAPLSWDERLNRAARFHADEMALQNYFAHNSICTLVANIDALYDASCNGAAACACVGGAVGCSPTCTGWSQRVGLFGASAAGEIISSYADPSSAFYQWLFESYTKSTCAYDQGPPTNGHRWNILKAGPAVGVGVRDESVGDFGGSATAYAIPSASHYPRQAASVEAWANWYDAAAPSKALVDVDGSCQAMTLTRGSPTNGAYRANVTGVGSGCHRYFFLFADDNGAPVRYPSTGSLGIGPDGSCADWDASEPALGAGCDCQPACDGLQCGDDGCGATCGSCGDGFDCQGGQCVPATGTGGTGGAGASSAGGSGIGGSGVGGSGVGGSGAIGANANAPAGDEAEGGCACSVVGPPARSPSRLAALALLGLLLGWRRGHHRPRR